MRATPRRRRRSGSAGSATLRVAASDAPSAARHGSSSTDPGAARRSTHERTGTETIDAPEAASPARSGQSASRTSRARRRQVAQHVAPEQSDVSVRVRHRAQPARVPGEEMQLAVTGPARRAAGDDIGAVRDAGGEQRLQQLRVRDVLLVQEDDVRGRSLLEPFRRRRVGDDVVDAVVRSGLRAHATQRSRRLATLRRHDDGVDGASRSTSTVDVSLRGCRRCSSITSAQRSTGVSGTKARRGSAGTSPSASTRSERARRALRTSARRGREHDPRVRSARARRRRCSR